MTFRQGRILLLGLVLTALAGCSSSSSTGGAAAAGGEDEKAVRAAWASLQEAIKAKDADKIWGLMDAKSQENFDKAAKTFQEIHGKTEGKDRERFTDEWGIEPDAVAKLTGKAMIKTAKFHKKYHEIPDSKIDKVTVAKDEAKINYTEPDTDKEELSLRRKDGAWKVVLDLPKVQAP
jgi:hypothetical protein